jgi:hypothetical protein
MRVSSLVAPALILALTSPALADIVIVEGVNNQSTDDVAFEDISNITQILGSVSGQVNNFAVTGTTTGPENLLSSSSITNSVFGSGSQINSLIFSLADVGTLSKIVFNINSAANGSVDISILEGDGTTFQSNFVLDGNGQNFFTITAINGQSIRTLTLTGVGTTFEDVRQLRVGGIVAGESAVPDAATWALMLLGFGFVGGALRSSRIKRTRISAARCEG